MKIKTTKIPFAFKIWINNYHKNYVKIKLNFTKINGLLNLLSENIIQRILSLVPTEKVKT